MIDGVSGLDLRALVNANFRQNSNRESRLQTPNSKFQTQSNQIDFLAIVVQEKVILSEDHLRNMIYVWQ